MSEKYLQAVKDGRVPAIKPRSKYHQTLFRYLTSEISYGEAAKQLKLLPNTSPHWVEGTMMFWASVKEAVKSGLKE